MLRTVFYCWIICGEIRCLDYVGLLYQRFIFHLIDHINKSVMKNLKNMIFTMFAFTDLIDSTVIQNGTIWNILKTTNRRVLLPWRWCLEAVLLRSLGTVLRFNQHVPLTFVGRQCGKNMNGHSRSVMQLRTKRWKLLVIVDQM